MVCRFLLSGTKILQNFNKSELHHMVYSHSDKGRISLLNGLSWVSTSGNNIPKNAVQGGIDSNGGHLFVAKAKNGKDCQWTPGKAGYHLQGGCHFTYDGKEIISKEYDILTKEPNSSVVLGWRICSNGVLPNNINTVCTSLTAGLHVARGYHQHSLYPGTLDTVNRHVYISYGGKAFTCERAEVLYQTISSEDRLLPYEGKITKYQPVFHDIYSSLQKGVIQLSLFMKDLKSAPTGRLDGIKFIQENLLPSVEKSKVEFENMIQQAQKLVHEVDTDLEKSMVELKNKKDTSHKLDEDIKKLNDEQKAKAQAVVYAEQQIKQKDNDLENAKNAVSIAMKKLHKSQDDRTYLDIVGGVLLSFVPFNTVVLEVANVFEEAVDSCRALVKTTNDERLSSQIALAKAKNNKSTIDVEIYELLQRKISKEEYFKEMGVAIDNFKDYQKLVIALNKNIKNFDRELTTFHEHFKVLASETDGGYSLESLKSNASTVLDVLLTLLQSQSVRSTCDQFQLKEMTRLLEI